MIKIWSKEIRGGCYENQKLLAGYELLTPHKQIAIMPGKLQALGKKWLSRNKTLT